MNAKTQDLLKTEMKKQLKQCTAKQQAFFVRCFSFDNLTLPIDEVIDKLEASKLEPALALVYRTIRANTEKPES